ADLDVSRNEVTVKTIVEPKRGFLGIGKKLAEIEMTVTEIKKPKENVENNRIEPKQAHKTNSEVHIKPDEATDETKNEVQSKPKEVETQSVKTISHPHLNE
ncbi:Jag N-terminal domain-containing protein, partial [Pediococcus damnosus]